MSSRGRDFLRKQQHISQSLPERTTDSFPPSFPSPDSSISPSEPYVGAEHDFRNIPIHHDERSVPTSAHEEISSPGQPLDAATLDFMEPRFGHDFSKVRIHAEGRDAIAARNVNASAYTVGQDIVFDSGRYMPETDTGKRLLAHELAHVVQQSRGGTITPPPLPTHPLEQAAHHAASTIVEGGTVSVTGASAAGIARQPRSLNESLNPTSMSDADLKQEITLIRQWLTDNPASSPERDQLMGELQVLETEVMQRNGRATAPENVPSSNVATKAVSDMTATEKLLEATNRANINAAVREKLSSLISAEALAVAILSFIGVFVASQFTPVGWAADLGIALTAIFVGTALFSAINHLVNFADARNAITSQQLDQAGTEFAQAVAEIGVDAIILFVTHGIAGPKGGVPYEGPPPPQVLLAKTPEGMLVPVAVSTISAETAAQLGIKASGVSQVLMSQGSGPGGRTRDFELPKLDHRTQAGDWKCGGELPKNGAERNLAIESWTPEELEEAAHDLELSIAARQAEQAQLGETSVGTEGQQIGAQHRDRIEQELDLLRAIQKKLSGT
jgi:hypothetical protein